MLALKDTCLHPTTQKPYVVSASGGVDNSPEGKQGGFTHAFVIEFASAEDRDFYAHKDEVHQAFVQKIGGLVDDVRVMDYEKGVY